MDSSWIGGMQALQIAFELVANGRCKSALVGVANLSIHPDISLQYLSMGKLNYSGLTKSFSADGKLYCGKVMQVPNILDHQN